MLTVATAAELRAELGRLREDARVLGGGRVAFVPTMGALHDGHLALVRRARALADVVVMSIFVNPLQFAPTEDLARYPRDPAGDATKARDAGVDLLFAPDVQELYPREPSVRVVPGPVADRWEGAVRPGHFAGVLTVVAKLFHLVQPDAAVFGQKDAQQCALVRAMVRDLDFPLRLDVTPTVRERDGLALSSRNVYLDKQQRRNARDIPTALRAAEQLFEQGDRAASTLVGVVEAGLAMTPDLTLDYVGLVDPESLEPVEQARVGSLLMVAARVGTTRLLDNVWLGRAEYGTRLLD